MPIYKHSMYGRKMGWRTQAHEIGMEMEHMSNTFQHIQKMTMVENTLAEHRNTDFNTHNNKPVIKNIDVKRGRVEADLMFATFEESQFYGKLTELVGGVNNG